MKLLSMLLSILLYVPSLLPTLNQPIYLNDYEKKFFSQNGEDGIIEKIFELIGTTNKYYVEFGVESGEECNTRYLREQNSWTGLLMDGGFQNDSINLKQEFITAENINELFEKNSVPNEFDLLSIDIDFNDFYIWKSLNLHYKPRVIIIEYNATHGPDQDKIIPYSPLQRWDSTFYFGASLLALYKLGRSLGYSLVCTDLRGVNSFFIRDDIAAKLTGKIAYINDINELYNKPAYCSGCSYQDELNRPLVSADDLLNLK